MYCRNHGKKTFYQAIKNEGRAKRSSISNNPDIIKKLARKEYLDQAIKAMKNNIEVLTSAANAIQPDDIVHLRKLMPEAYRSLPDEFFFDGWMDRPGISQQDRYLEGIRRHVEWAKEPYEMSTYKPENRKYPTSAGIKVRSKSEQAIVEQLVNYGVPFRYEEVIWINGWPYSSDFTFRNRRLEKFYWEHAGMMDLQGYRHGHKHKMDLFEDIGIVPWKNLIVTYDMDGVINVPLVKSIIENEVLPRL